MNGTGKPIQSLGIVSNDPKGSVIYVTPAGTVTIISNLEFFNASGGTTDFYLYKSVKGMADKVLLYKLTLSDGDLISDDSERVLPEGSSLIAKSTLPLMNYVISGYENELV